MNLIVERKQKKRRKLIYLQFLKDISDTLRWLRSLTLFALFAALLYKCEAQRSSCGQCLKAPSAFECGWCAESRKCLLRQHCPSPEQNWMHHGRHNLRCSHPRITKVRRRTGDPQSPACRHLLFVSLLNFISSEYQCFCQDCSCRKL